MTIDELRRLWDEFSEVPVDNDDQIECDFHGFERGTDRTEIWQWFDERCPNGLVRDILGEDLTIDDGSGDRGDTNAAARFYEIFGIEEEEV